MRCTERSEMPIALAMARPVQWVAWCGGVVQAGIWCPKIRSVAGALLTTMPRL